MVPRTTTSATGLCSSNPGDARPRWMMSRVFAPVPPAKKEHFSPHWGSDTVVDAGGNVVPDHRYVLCGGRRTCPGGHPPSWPQHGGMGDSGKPDARSAGSSTFDRYGRQWTVVLIKWKSRGPNDQTQVRLKTTLSGYKAYNESDSAVSRGDQRREGTCNQVGRRLLGRRPNHYLRTAVVLDKGISISGESLRLGPVWTTSRCRPGQKTEVRVLSLKVPPKGLLSKTSRHGSNTERSER